MSLSSRSNRTAFWFVMLFLVVPVAIPHLIPRPSDPATFQVVGPARVRKAPTPAPEPAPPPRPVE